jgi:hypothetical protein
MTHVPFSKDFGAISIIAYRLNVFPVLIADGRRAQGAAARLVMKRTLLDYPVKEGWNKFCTAPRWSRVSYHSEALRRCASVTNGNIDHYEGKQ